MKYSPQASPWPEVTWLKDSGPVSKRVTISNAEGASQLLIPSAERCDTGIYTIMVKNIVGQETFSIEIRVTGWINGMLGAVLPACTFREVALNLLFFIAGHSVNKVTIILVIQ